MPSSNSSGCRRPRPQTPRTARSPSSRSPIRMSGNRPACSPSSERSISSRPSGTATESFGNPLTVAGKNTFAAMPARAMLEVTGTTWVCQTFTLSTSSEDTTTHGRRLSSSIQCTAPRATTVRNAPSGPMPPMIPRPSEGERPQVRRQPTAAARAPSRSEWRRNGGVDQQPKSRTARRGFR